MNNQRNRIVLLIISVYLILINLVGFLITFYGILNKFENLELKEALFVIPLLVVSVVMVIWNWKVIFGGKDHNIHKYLSFNKYFSLLQIIQIKIAGVYFIFSYGIEIIFYYIQRNSSFRSGVSYELFNLKYTILYDSHSSGFLIGINAMALSIFLILRKILNSNKERFNEGMLSSIKALSNKEKS